MASNNEAPDARVLREKGNGLYKNGQLAEAITAYSEASKVDPSDPLPLSNLSAAYFEVGKYDECITAVANALRLSEGKDDSFVQKLRTRVCLAYLHTHQVSAADSALAHLNESNKDRPTFQTAVRQMLEMQGSTDETSTRKKVIFDLPRYKPCLESTPEYFVFGHDSAKSLFDRDLASIRDNDYVSLLFAGIGDARNLYATFIGIADHELSTNSKKNYRFLANDLMPEPLARNLVLWLLMDRIDVEHDSDERDQLLNAIFFIFSAPIMPSDAYHILGDGIDRAIQALETNKLPSWIMVPPQERQILLEVITGWKLRAPGIRSMKETLELVVRDNDMRPTKSIEEQDAPSHCRKELDYFNDTGALFPAPKFLQADSPLRELVAKYKTKKSAAVIKDLKGYLAQTWKPNSTSIHLGWEDEGRNHLEHSFQPHAIASVLYDESKLGPPANPVCFHDYVANFFLEVASAIHCLQRRIRVLVRCGDIAEVLEATQHGFYGVSGAKNTSLPQAASEVWRKFDRMHFSNIPDYVGGNFTSFLYAIPVMKNHKAAYLTSNCLRNPDLWPSVEAFNNEYLLINDKETLLRLTQVSLTKESREHLQRIRSMSFPLIPMGNIPLVDFIQWQRKTSTPFQFSQLVPRQNLTHWLYSLFFKLMVPPRRQDRGMSIIFTSLNLTAFLRLLIHLHSIGYPSHWLSSVLLSILQNNVTTTARHPETYPLTIEEARRQNPPKKLSTAPFIPELRALTSIFQSLLPFAVLDPSLLTSDRIVHCTIGFKDLHYYDASRPDFILVFRHKKLNKDFRAVPGSDSLRSLLISDAGQRTAVGKAREEGLCVITTFKWDRPAGTVSFWLGENDLEVLVKGGENAWEGHIWRTDYWFPAGGPVNLQTELKKGKLWTGRDGEANTLPTI